MTDLSAPNAPERRSRLAENRHRIDVELGTSSVRRFYSPATYGLYAQLGSRIGRHVTGNVLDAGCGTMPFREALSRYADEYHSMDVTRRVPTVEIVADIQDMPHVASSQFDTVFCSEVLEHVPDPGRAVAEIARVLRPGGKLLLSVPFLARLHEEPYDFFRYTRHGLASLLEQRGQLRIIEIATTGSLFSFLGHQVSSAVVCAVWHVPVLRQVAFWLNASLCTLPCQWLDRVSKLSPKFPLGYVAVAQKG
jgi:SAM-dependent methyltransferase